MYKNGNRTHPGNSAPDSSDFFFLPLRFDLGLELSTLSIVLYGGGGATLGSSEPHTVIWGLSPVLSPCPSRPELKYTNSIVSLKEGT